jgi:chemosensory pili system protein ChpC
MSTDNINVHGQLIPLKGMQMVLPNTAIAEIISQSKPEKLDDSPDWLLGMVAWRGFKIPLMSFEAIIGKTAGRLNKNCRIVILNGMNGDKTLPFYGLIAQGIPRLMSLNTDNIVDDITENAAKSPYILRSVLVREKPAAIPDQIKVEKELVKLGAIIKDDAAVADQA